MSLPQRMTFPAAVPPEPRAARDSGQTVDIGLRDEILAGHLSLLNQLGERTARGDRSVGLRAVSLRLSLSAFFVVSFVVSS